MAHPQISIARQCDLVGCHGQPTITIPRGRGRESDIDAVTGSAIHGHAILWHPSDDRLVGESCGYAVNHKRAARLLHTMGLRDIYPKPRLSQPHPAHRVYPYLLRGVPITRVNQVWSTDITYPLAWWVYLPGGGDGLVPVAMSCPGRCRSADVTFVSKR